MTIATLRLSYSIAQRAPHTYPTEIEYDPCSIPAEAIVSMGSYAVSHDEAIFPDSFTFLLNEGERT
jgi:cytochrome P450